MRRGKTLSLRLREFFSDRGEGGRGQAMVEFAVVFPLQLFVTIGIMQLILLFVAEIVVNYAAFRACRAAQVTSWDENGDGTIDTADMLINARRAAATILFPLASDYSGADVNDQIDVPGWGTLRRSDSAYAKLLVHEYKGDDPDRDLTIVVEWDQELIFPVVDSLFATFYGDASTASDDRVFGTADEAFDEAGYLGRAPLYKSGKGWVRKIDGRYHFVIVKECTLYRRQAINADTDMIDSGGT